MPYEQRDNSGVLFKNTKKQDGSKAPDCTGNCMVNGVEMRVSGWWKNPKNGGGNRFLSLAFQPKDEQDQRRQDTDDGF